LNNPILAIDIGTTNTLAIVAANDFNNKINILGVGRAKSEGIEKGNIVDINLAGTSIKEAADTALSSAGSPTSTVVVSLSGANTKTLRSSGSINIPSGHITKNEIKQVLNMALYNAQVIPDYEVIHVLPIFFRVDDGSSISNPLNMNGTRLEVSVNVITTKKTSLVNVKNALKRANLEISKFVLSGYANAISTLEYDQKKLGTAVISMGGTTTEIVVYKGTSIIYNDFLPIGSEHITRDISTIFHTPYSAANMIKKQYATLLPLQNDENSIKKVKLPILGNETESKEISLDQIQPVLHARIEEILCLAKDRMINSSILEKIDGGIVLTGGTTFIPGIKELATEVFKGLPVKISNPKNIQNGYIDFNSPTMSNIVGLLLYELDYRNGFELDSNNNIKYASSLDTVKEEEVQKTQPAVDKTPAPKERPSTNPLETIQDIGAIKEKNKKSEKGLFNSLIDKFTRWI
jgi:cell division protein FtsA